MTPLDRYVRHIEAAPNEDTRRALFLLFIAEVARPGLIETEKRVNITADGKTATGRVDLMYGDLVMEFKTSMRARKLADAEGQLRRYASGLLNAEKRDYILVATDGIRFNVYGCQIADGAPLRPDDVTLFLKSYTDLKRRVVDGDLYADGAAISKMCELVTRSESSQTPTENAQAAYRLGRAPRRRRSGTPWGIAGTARGRRATGENAGAGAARR